MDLKSKLKWAAYPLYLWVVWVRIRARNWLVTAVVLGVLFVGAGLAIGLHLSVDQGGGWNKTTAVVLHAGTTPVHYYPGETRSVVGYVSGGARQEYTVELPWWKRDGSAVPVWTKGPLVSAQDPTGWAHWILMLGLFPGIIIWGVLLAVLVDARQSYWGWCEKSEFGIAAVTRKRQRQARRDRHKAAPGSLEELIELCRQHGNVVITLQFAASFLHCHSGVSGFRNRHFPGATKATIEQLVPHLNAPGEDWRRVVEVVIARLKQKGVIQRGYQCKDHIAEPPRSEEDAPSV